MRQDVFKYEALLDLKKVNKENGKETIEVLNTHFKSSSDLPAMSWHDNLTMHLIVKQQNLKRSLYKDNLLIRIHF